MKPYHIFPQYKLAVVAVTTDTIPTISNSDESTTFSDPVETVQYWIDHVYKYEDVKYVVVMTHIG